MKNFILSIILFVALCWLGGELIIRSFRLVGDIPQRTIGEEYGLQSYIPGQTGYAKKAKDPWIVNEYGWLGVTNVDKNPLFSVIGDSFIENLMNPSTCNQGYVLQNNFKNYGFFEAGRSGVTFIEALELSRLLDKQIDPQVHLIYLKDHDFYESLTNKGKFIDRVQIDIDQKTILKSEMKAPFAKKVLYSNKLLYYFYLRFPLFVSVQNMGGDDVEEQKKDGFDTTSFDKLFQYSAENYSVDKIVFIFNPETSDEFVQLAIKYGFKTLLLDSSEDENIWTLPNDNHWSCYGHSKAAEQVSKFISDNFSIN